MRTILCECCNDNGERVPATWSAPSSSNAGKTVDFSPVCDSHAAGWWEGADWDGRHLMRRLKQPEKRIWMLLTQDEWRMLQKIRARAMTGYDVHKRDPFGYYVWRMGTQPGDDWVARMAAPDPIQAARRFLDTYRAYHELTVLAGHKCASIYADPEKR